MALWFLLLACGLVAIATWAVTALVLRALHHHQVYDQPNERSSHDEAKPRGGGLAVVPVLLLAWVGAQIWLGTPPGFWSAMIGVALVAVVSWWDDLKDLPAALRLLAQILAVGTGLAGFGEVGAIFQGLLPAGLDWFLAGLLWLWFINLFNFMDGIDGISGVEAAAIGIGLGLVAWLGELPLIASALPWLLAAAALGFLVLNWEPSKIFLGDVGSVSLGFLLGWLLLRTAAEGHWAPALILPAYYLADASLTLARRALRRAPIWRAHREHFYQRAVQGGLSHARVSGYVALCNVALVAFAMLAVAGQLGWALAASALTTLGLLVVLRRAGSSRPVADPRP